MADTANLIDQYLKQWADNTIAAQSSAITQAYQDAFPGYLAPLMGNEMYRNSNYGNALTKYAARQATDIGNMKQNVLGQQGMMGYQNYLQDLYRQQSEAWQQKQWDLEKQEYWKRRAADEALAEQNRRNNQGMYSSMMDRAAVEGATGAGSTGDMATAQERWKNFSSPGYYEGGQWKYGTRPAGTSNYQSMSQPVTTKPINWYNATYGGASTTANQVPWYNTVSVYD